MHCAEPVSFLEYANNIYSLLIKKGTENEVFPFQCLMYIFLDLVGITKQLPLDTKP